VTLNGVIARILLNFTEFDSFAGLLRHSNNNNNNIADSIYGAVIIT